MSEAKLGDGIAELIRLADDDIRATDEQVDAARADLRVLRDAAIVTRWMTRLDLYAGFRGQDDTGLSIDTQDWEISRFDESLGRTVILARGSTVNGLPVLDDAARKILGET